MSEKKYPRIRVAAIILAGDTILMAIHEKEGSRYYVLPGGGVDYGESMQEAVVREVKEETNLDVRAGDMILVHDSIPPDLHRHIVNVYFLAEVIGGELRVGEHDKRLRDLEYLPVTELSKIEMYPAIGEEILLGIRNGFVDCPRYVGNLWVEEE